MSDRKREERYFGIKEEITTGNRMVNGTTLTAGSLVISFLLLCLWSVNEGLVSLFGTLIATVRHPQYLGPGSE